MDINKEKLDSHINELLKERHLLIIDDEIPILESLKIALSLKYKAFTALDYDEAKPILEKERIDVVILDIQLPKMRGDDILIKIKEKDSCTEVIMHTVIKDDVSQVVKCIKLGAYNYLTKPCDIDTIYGMVNDAYSKCILHRTYKMLDDNYGKYWKSGNSSIFDYLDGLYKTLFCL